jgi:hypothetical protein
MSGHILDSTGAQPAGQINVSLSRAVPDPGALYLAARPVSGDGYFEFRGVPPGSHVISVSTWRTDGQTEYASVPVTVVAEDVTGLTITTSPGVALNGTVVAQDGLLPDLHGVTVVAVPAGSARLQARITAVVDRQFLVPNLVGTFRLDLQGVPAGWTLLSIHVDGVDVTDEPVTFGSGEPHAVVTLTNRLTEIRGVVTRNRRPADAEVVVFPDDPAKWATQRFIRTTRVDEKGAFSLQGLPPHDSYLAVATDYVEPSELFDPEFLERLRARAVVFRLDDGQARRLPLTYVERSAIDGR